LKHCWLAAVAVQVRHNLLAAAVAGLVVLLLLKSQSQGNHFKLLLALAAV
jgi:hypothetical protein